MAAADDADDGGAVVMGMEAEIPAWLGNFYKVAFGLIFWSGGTFIAFIGFSMVLAGLTNTDIIGKLRS